MSGQMQNFPETVEEFMEQYKMIDRKEVYSNGTEYVPIFRMKQWFEHEKANRTAKVTQVERGSATLLVWRCENCGQYMHRASWAREVNYCSHCGARLDWGEE